MLLVVCRAILAELVLPFQARDLNFKTNNALHHFLHVIIGQLELPGFLEESLMLPHKLLQQGIEYSLIFYHARYAVSMNNRVVPGGNTQLDLVPGWSNVGMGSLKHDQHFSCVIKETPLRVATCHVASERSVGTA